MPEYTLADAEAALRENLRLLNQAEHKVARNLNTALLGICDHLRRHERDLDSLHSKLQPILRELSEDKYALDDLVRKKVP